MLHVKTFLRRKTLDLDSTNSQFLKIFQIFISIAIYHDHFERLRVIHSYTHLRCILALYKTRIKRFTTHTFNDDFHALLCLFSLYHRRDIVSESLIKSHSFIPDFLQKHWSIQMSRIAPRSRPDRYETRFSLTKSKISERDGRGARTRNSWTRPMPTAPRTIVLVTSGGKLKRR